MVLSFLRRPRELAAEPSIALVPRVELMGFATDSRFRGSVDLTADRLTDLLNGPTPLALSEVLLESLADGRLVRAAELVVERDELCILVADGPRGNPERRVRTRTSEVSVEVGPYHVEGSVHGAMASDPLQNLHRRARFVPMTDAVISYDFAGMLVEEYAQAVLVNLELANDIRAAETGRASSRNRT